jgi:hypothetical protein
VEENIFVLKKDQVIGGVANFTNAGAVTSDRRIGSRMTGISLHIQWPLTSQWHGNFLKENIFFVADQTPSPRVQRARARVATLHLRPKGTTVYRKNIS